jgi:hypothetical protein
MGTILNLLLVLLSSSAFADDTSTQNLVIEAAVPVQIQPTKIDDIDFLTINKKIVYQIGPVQMSQDEQVEYETLNEEEKSRFHEERRKRLTRLARILSANKISYEFIVSIKDFVIGEKLKTSNEQEIVNPETRSAILNAYNTSLWRKAKKLGSRYSIVGLSMVTGFRLQAGFLKYPIGKAKYLAFDIGFDRESDSLFFRLDTQSENFDLGMSVDAALVAKFLIYRANATKIKSNTESAFSTSSVERGHSYYPPSIPLVGIGIESSSTRDSAGINISLGPDLFSWAASRNSFEKKTVYLAEVPLKLSVSQKLKNLAQKIVNAFKLNKTCETLLQQ